MQTTHQDTASPGSYNELTERAVAYVLDRPQGVPEDMLVHHVFGADTSPALWRGLLGSLLEDETRLQLGPDRLWRPTTSEAGQAFPIEYVVLDVETTGLKPRYNRITEIAIIVVSERGERMVWSSLVNPEREVPRQISRLTGIDNQMVASAPRFASIAPTILELIGDRLVVGHNVDFDIGFLNTELVRTGLQRIVNQTLDTLSLADALAPSLRRLSLGEVARHLGVEHSRAHRAVSDAEATAGVLDALRQLASNNGDGSLDLLLRLAASRRNRRSGHRKVSRGRSVLDSSHLENIPNLPGVYLMKDVNDRVIYVGKAKDLRKRVSSYYSQPLGYTRKMDGLLESICDIEIELTGSELEALVLESQLIRRYRPRFNSQQRNVEQYAYIRVDTENPWPTVTLARDRRNDDARYFGPFKSTRQARDAVRLINDVLPLRTCRRAFRDARSYGTPCIELSMRRCLGPCVGVADPDEYKGFVSDVLAYLDGDDQRLLPTLHGRLEKAAATQDFERAGKLRDQIQRLGRIALEQANLDVLAKAGQILLVLPGKSRAERQIWYLCRGIRWAAFEVVSGEKAVDLADRLDRARHRAAEFGDWVNMTHHTVDEASITSRWVRNYSTSDAIIRWSSETPAREIAELALIVTPLDPDQYVGDVIEGEND